MSGKKASADKKKIEKPKDEEEGNTLKLPTEMFNDFREIDRDNEELFELLSVTVIINYLLKTCLKIENKHSGEDDLHKIRNEPKMMEDIDKNACWNIALEFPDVVANNGRVKLHELADTFGLAHHSMGRKGKSRRTIVYPKTMF